MQNSLNLSAQNDTSLVQSDVSICGFIENEEFTGVPKSTVANKSTLNLAVINQQNVLGKKFTVYGDYENPLFLAKDIAQWIEHSNLTVMVNSVDDDEKIITRTKDCLGRDNVATFLTENGLYEVLMLSRKPIAKEFKKEVKKILHKIRTTGGYTVPRSYAEALQIAADQAKRIEEQQVQLIETKQRAEAAEGSLSRLTNASGEKTVQEVAKILGYGSNNFYALLRGMGIFYKDNGINLPKQEYINSGYFIVKVENFTRNGEDCTYSRIFVTAKGLTWLEKKTKESA